MADDLLLRLGAASKSYPMRRRPAAELWGHLIHRPTRRDHRVALHPLNLELRRGEAVGVVGLNGAGKSTLLQLASGVMSPSAGQAEIRGRVAALLELGSGFDPEATGWHNISLYAATLGLSAQQVEARRTAIIDFSGLRDFIHSPVKSYSTGMQVRLAFSVATAVEPDVLIIDEALSVGDGVFAKRSFDRVMALRRQGAGLLLSSHALFHIDLFCERTLWLHQGHVRAFGDTASVLPRYREFLDQQGGGKPAGSPEPAEQAEPASGQAIIETPAFELAEDQDPAQLLGARVSFNGTEGTELCGAAGSGTLDVLFEIRASALEPSPRAAVVLSSETGRILGSALSPACAFQANGPDGRGTLRFQWPDPGLNRGRYRIGVYLLCSQARFVYAWSDPHAHLQLSHDGPHQGALLIPGQWTRGGAA
jgi:lipopolysaccharide transport system ATP-binding protein